MFDLQVFDYEHNQEVRTIFANGEIWFVAKDVCGILEITDHLQAVEKLDDEERGWYKIPTPYGLQEMGCINEPGLYRLIFRSNKPEAKKFQKWIYKEVIPQIRKTGFYSLRGSLIPAFIRRYNENWDRVEQGYFSVINELVIRIYGRLEHVRYMMPDKGLSGREMRPDISVGKLFAAWIKEQHPEHENDFKMYKHVLPDGKEIDARQYKFVLTKRKCTVSRSTKKFKKGDLILCTRYSDGDPRDPWSVGFFAHSIIESNGIVYYCVQDENGKVALYYYRHAVKITEKKGKFLLKYHGYIEDLGISLFWWLKHLTNLENIEAYISTLTQKEDRYFKRLGDKPITSSGYERMDKIEKKIQALQYMIETWLRCSVR